jgi:hypothetical protein
MTSDGERHFNFKLPFSVCVGVQQYVSAYIWKTQAIQTSLKEKCMAEEMKEVNQTEWKTTIIQFWLSSNTNGETYPAVDKIRT